MTRTRLGNETRTPGKIKDEEENELYLDQSLANKRQELSSLESLEDNLKKKIESEALEEIVEESNTKNKVIVTVKYGRTQYLNLNLFLTTPQLGRK